MTFCNLPTDSFIGNLKVAKYWCDKTEEHDFLIGICLVIDWQ